MVFDVDDEDELAVVLLHGGQVHRAADVGGGEHHGGGEKGHLEECFQLKILEDTARYAGLLLAPAEGFGLRPRLFLPFGQKKSLLCCFGPFLAIFGVQ